MQADWGEMGFNRVRGTKGVRFDYKSDRGELICWNNKLIKERSEMMKMSISKALDRNILSLTREADIGEC